MGDIGPSRAFAYGVGKFCERRIQKSVRTGPRADLSEDFDEIEGAPSVVGLRRPSLDCGLDLPGVSGNLFRLQPRQSVDHRFCLPWAILQQLGEQ